MTSLRLYKREKLCSLTAIEALFSGKDSRSCSAFPVRAVWRVNNRRNHTAQFFISVPKKRLRHAVDRVKMRRRIREAYRLNRHYLQLPENMAIDMTFIYLNNGLQDYATVEHAIIRLLGKISNAATSFSDNDEKTD